MTALHKIDPLELARKQRDGAIKNGFSETQATIVEQIYAQEPFFNAMCGVRVIINIKEKETEGIQISTKLDGRVVNIQVWYNAASDYYDIKTFRVDPLKAETKEIYNTKDVAFTELIQAIQSALGA